MNFSNLFRLNLKDLGKAILVVVLTSLIASVKTYFDNGTLPTLVEFYGAFKIAVFAGLGYLLKNLFTNNVGSLFSKDEDPEYGGGVKNPKP